MSPSRRRRPRRMLARELCYLGRFDEAERLLEEARAVPPPGSGVRVMAAAAEALLLAHRGELEQAEALARTAVATAETKTDTVWWQAFTHEDLATVLERAGRIDEAREALERSLAIWERKGCLPSRVVSASRSTRSAGRRSDHHEQEPLRAYARWSALNGIPPHSRIGSSRDTPEAGLPLPRVRAMAISARARGARPRCSHRPGRPRPAGPELSFIVRPGAWRRSTAPPSYSSGGTFRSPPWDQPPAKIDANPPASPVGRRSPATKHRRVGGPSGPVTSSCAAL